MCKTQISYLCDLDLWPWYWKYLTKSAKSCLAYSSFSLNLIHLILDIKVNQKWYLCKTHITCLCYFDLWPEIGNLVLRTTPSISTWFTWYLTYRYMLIRSGRCARHKFQVYVIYAWENILDKISLKLNLYIAFWYILLFLIDTDIKDNIVSYNLW